MYECRAVVKHRLRSKRRGEKQAWLLHQPLSSFQPALDLSMPSPNLHNYRGTLGA